MKFPWLTQGREEWVQGGQVRTVVKDAESV